MLTNRITKSAIIFLAVLAAFSFGSAGHVRASDYQISTFPIATTTGQELAVSAAFDGTNYLVGIQGDAAHRANITAQLVSPTGTPVGSRISVGRTGGMPSGVAFDGTNYLMVWFDDVPNTGQLYGAFISKAGAVVNVRVIDPGPLTVSRNNGGLAFGGGKYLAIYYKTDAASGKDIVYGRLISPAGEVGTEIRISTGFGNQGDFQNVAFDGTRFFVVWNNHATNTEVKGRFVNPSGTLGTEITVKASGLPNDNPLTVAFDGTNYLVVWTDEVNASLHNWDVFGQLVTPAGALSGGVISISTAPGQQFLPLIAFDGTNYLISWTDMRNDANGNWACDAEEGTCLDIRGQFVSKSGALVGSEFIINNDAGNQLGGFGGQAVNGKLFGLINTGFNIAQDSWGDVLGVILSSGATTGTVSFSGVLTKFSDNTPVNGGVVAMDGTPSISTTTNSEGSFTLTGLPANTEFTLKFTKPDAYPANYIPTYTHVLQPSAGTTITAPRSYNLFTQEDLNNWAVASGLGAIRGRVMNGANNTAGYVSGATVSYASFLGKTYTVKYEDNEGILTTGTGTSANGKYYILNVAEGDTVTVSAAHPYYSFPQPRQFATHGAAAHQGLVNGAAVSGRVAIGGHIMNTADPVAGIKSATIEQFGAASPINATTSNLDGAFYLSVPATTTLQLKFSKPKDTTLAPTYSANMSFGADNLAVGDYNLFLKTILSNSVASGGWGVTPGKGIIRARVKDQAGNYLGGATVTATSALHPAIPYIVCYDNACTLKATPDTGRYIVKNVDDGDTVTVTAQKQGWTFNTRFFPTHADSVHQGSITGATLTLSATGQTFTAAGTGSVNVVAPDGVAWQAVSNASWIHITSGSSGTGSAVVSYTVDTNAGATRTGTITIGGQTFTVSQTAAGSGYPIATTTGQEFAGSAAFDGTNYLVGIQGDASARNKITAQLVSPSGALVGSRISVGRTGGLPLVAFDGTNYLMVWFDDAINSGQLYGVLISKSGVVNTPFVIDPGPLSVSRGIGGVAFGGGKYMTVYYKTDAGTDKDIVYGRLVSTSGTVGNEIIISTDHGKQTENNVVFDGTNFFVVWCDNDTNKAVKGRIISPSGELLGTEITVKADNSYPNDNPLTVAFAGGNYLVAWTDQVSTSPNNWDVFGQFVTPAGALSGGKISISTAPGQQFWPSIAFDGANYLISWTDMRNDANWNWACDDGEGTCFDIRGQFVSKSGALVGSEFIINNDAGNQLGGFGGQAVNGKLFGLLNTGVAMSGNGLAGGDVYGVSMNVEKIPMMNFTVEWDRGMNLYLYDPVSQTMDTVKQNLNATLTVSLNSGQTMLLYTELISENPKTYSMCLYNISSKTTTCLATPMVEEDSASFDSNGKILFIDKSDGILKKMNPDGTNITTISTPASPYRFSVFWLSPDRQKIMAVEERRSDDYYTTNYSRLVLMNADGMNRTIIKAEVLGEWNWLFWKADSSRIFYYYHTFNVVGGVYQGETPHYVVIDIPGGTETDLTGSAVGGKDENVCTFTKSGNLLSLMYHELYNGQTGALIAVRADVPTMMEARVGFDRSGEIYFANLDGTNFLKFVESSTPVNGVCGTANGQAFTSVPTANLCSVGTPTVVAGSGPWTWSCAGSDGGANDSCSANVQTSSTGFQEDFSATVLDPLWQVVTGRGRYSLSDNLGHLRYYLEGPQAYSGSSLGVVSTWSPSLTLIRPFDGDNWVFKTKANYNIRWQGTGAQYNNIYIAFGEGGNNYLRISRGTDQWYGANILSAELIINGQIVASNNAMRSPNDVVVSDWLRYTYWYEIARSGQCITLRYSYDGTNYSKVFSYSLPAQVAAVQRAIIDANVWTTAGSYADWDYMYVDPTAIQTKADVDGDGAANLADAILILKVMAGMNPAGIRTDYPTCGADVNCDGKIGLPEAIHILQVLGGLRASTPPPP